MCVLFLSYIASDPARAGEALHMEIETAALSKFVWRGAPWTDDPVLWPQMTFRRGGFRTYLLFNFDFTDINDDQYQCNEIDIIADNTFRFGRFGVAPGFIHYTSPTDFFDPVTKILLGLKMDTMFSPSLNFRFDVKGVKGSYVILKTHHAFPVARTGAAIAADFWVSGGSARYYGVDKGIVVTDTMVRLSLPFPVSDAVTLTPGVELTSLVDPALRREYGADGRAFVYYVSMTCALF